MRRPAVARRPRRIPGIWRRPAAIALCAALWPSAAAASTPDRPAYALTLKATAGGTRWAGHERITFRNPGPAPLARIWLRLWDNGWSGCHPQHEQVRVVGGGRAGGLAVGCTALPVDLGRAVPPGGRGAVELDLRIDVPRPTHRFGRWRGQVLLANALPLLAVRDAQGWHLPRYTPEGMSFYAVTGSFRVTFDTPAGLDVAATGVRDFAFVAGRLELVTAEAGGVRIHVWRDPSTPPAAARQALRQATASLAFDGRLFGRYPYRELDVVIGDYPGFGGQEEPQLVITHPDAPIVAHEVAHQWWYGVVGVDEYAAPWLNEGFASYTQAREFGEAPSLCQQVSWPEPRDRLGLGMDYWSGRPDEFGAVVYGQGACLLQDLARTLGQPAFDRLLQRWYARGRFGNGTTSAFQRLAQAAATRDLSAFWKRHRLP
jgi:hypothetical protein